MDGAPVCYSPEQKTLLYCAFYMPMHLYSSYHVYRRHLKPPKGKILFIDFGCGPLTSGIAYHAFLNDACAIEYIGIDRSIEMRKKEMRKKAEEVNTIGLSSRNRIYNRCCIMNSWERLPLYLDSILRGDQTEIVFNFCYFLASQTLNVNDMTEKLQCLIKRYQMHPIRAVYQNPPVNPLRCNWNALKACLMQHGFQSSELNKELFSYPRLTDGNLHRDVRVECETLYRPSSRRSRGVRNALQTACLTAYSCQGDETMEQQGLFLDAPKPPNPDNKDVEALINGLTYVRDYINEEQHDRLLKRIDANDQRWMNDLKRRVQHYGYRYDYKARRVDNSDRLGELPIWLQRLCQKLRADGHLPELPDQVIVNEYEPGQGIASHIDCEPCFKNAIASLSLGSACIMEFKKKGEEKTTKTEAWLAPRSLVVLKGAARYEWKHGIPPRKSDVWEGVKHSRGRRVSLTFRKVIVDGIDGRAEYKSSG
ncbi:MAG: alpha-ketoglutarate-dependent dioxygenase AlkB [Candidatus Poribacteria bacterium]|nr:alpha-ketoglutarate-dependent dioxygenase AlkB [Candidatus Poribacteria bacterium]